MWMVSNIATTGTKCLWFTHHPSLHPFIYPSIHPSIHSSIHPSIHGTYINSSGWYCPDYRNRFWGEGFYPLPNFVHYLGILNVMPMCQWREDKSLGSHSIDDTCQLGQGPLFSKILNQYKKCIPSVPCQHFCRPPLPRGLFLLT
jgi:hypothetical protein